MVRAAEARAMAVAATVEVVKEMAGMVEVARAAGVTVKKTTDTNCP